MKLCGVDLPEIKKENAIPIIELAQDLHRDKADRCNSENYKWQWDTYWVKVYDLIINLLKNGVVAPNG